MIGPVRPPTVPTPEDARVINAWRLWHGATFVRVWPACEPLTIFGRPLR